MNDVDADAANDANDLSNGGSSREQTSDPNGAQSNGINAAARAIEAGFGRPPVFIREGGSIPIVTDFYENLKSDTLILGWGLDDDNTHSPNEKFSLADFNRGIKASTYLWNELANLRT